MNRFPLCVATLLLGLLLPSGLTLAVPILNDPNGFEGLPWESTLTEGDQFTKVEEAGRLLSYELKAGHPTLGTIPVEVLRYTTFDGKFGRVLVRYQGKDTHEQILAYLQTQYGPLDRTPGQITVGPIRVYAWHGFDTEITLRYESRIERGVIFFESRILREKLSEGNSGTVF
ncbi:hypothetical protein [Nitrospira lenta]|uniref:Uncharacterized protein n=1 Tax=Nitrospira lenta TaxID=1436998 RepID=A0A330L1M8_9BACT|nr:hypothetical protein [Nitrospira lenta]SPP63671.1 conserved exported hypothetical protein [Nitrospira lenta]